MHSKGDDINSGIPDFYCSESFHWDPPIFPLPERVPILLLPFLFTLQVSIVDVMSLASVAENT